MNQWTEKSIIIANSDGYLDRLQNVYPVSFSEERKIPKNIVDDLKKSFTEQDDENLIIKLISLEKFPIKDPYIAFLRRNRGEFIKKNPKTVSRISKGLYELGFDTMLKGIKEPKEFNRQIGSLFKKWIPKIGFPILKDADFENYKNICFLDGNDAYLKRYANNKLQYDIEKGIDMIIKANKNYVFLGEAKFLTDYGGHQMAQFEDALRMSFFKKGRCIGMAILDGVVWIKSKNKMHKKIARSKELIMSSLLLKEFLMAINKDISNLDIPN